MIIAYKSGLLTLASLVSETKDTIRLQPYDQKSPIVVDKESESVKVFDSVYDAIHWIEVNNEL